MQILSIANDTLPNKFDIVNIAVFDGKKAHAPPK